MLDKTSIFLWNKYLNDGQWSCHKREKKNAKKVFCVFRGLPCAPPNTLKLFSAKCIFFFTLMKNTLVVISGFLTLFFASKNQEDMHDSPRLLKCLYGTKCVGRIVTKSMSYLLYFFFNLKRSFLLNRYRFWPNSKTELGLSISYHVVLYIPRDSRQISSR